jgi:hypothetical protein
MFDSSEAGVLFFFPKIKTFSDLCIARVAKGNVFFDPVPHHGRMLVSRNACTASQSSLIEFRSTSTLPLNKVSLQVNVRLLC